jgi:hypothetical protein
MAPDMASAILATLQQIKAAIALGEFEQAIRLGQYLQKIDDLLADPMFTPVRQEIRRAVQEAIRYQTTNLPGQGKVNGRIAVMFDYLNPVHVEAVRTLETRVITTMKEEARDVIRAHIENGLRDGKGPRAVAKGIRDVVGLAPNQLQAVDNFRKALEEGDVSKALGYKLRDKRFKVSDSMTPAQIDKAVDAYRKRMVAFHSETVARTATLDTLKRGQQLAWEESIRQGLVDPNKLTKTWVTVGDERVRDEHVAVNGETVPWNSFYSTGEYTPGASTYNCRCLSRFSQRTLNQTAQP